jgi:hypothetical protein
MLNSPFSDSHHLRRVAQPGLHFLQHGFMLPAPDSPLRARCALRFHGAAPAFRTPVTVQRQAFFNVGIAPDQRLVSRANVFFFCRVIDEGIVIETPVSLGSGGHRLGHISAFGRLLPVVKGRFRPKDIKCLANPEQSTDVEIKFSHGLSGVQTGYSRAPYAAANVRLRL